MSKNKRTEVRNDGNQCKQISAPSTATPFLLAFSHIAPKFQWGAQGKNGGLARYCVANGERARTNARADAQRTHTRDARQCTRAHANAPTHAPTHAHAHPCARTHAHTRVTHARTHASRTRGAPRRPPRSQSGTGGTSARAPSAKQSKRLHPRQKWSEPCKRGVADKERITQGTMHTAKRNDKGYYRGTRYCLSRKIFREIWEVQ